MWVLVDKLQELEVSFHNEFDTIGVEQKSHIGFKKQKATAKAIYSAFCELPEISGWAQAGEVWHLQVGQYGH